MMTYYRLALHDQQTARWIWKTTELTSLQSVFQLLRIYGALPQDRIRVFTAPSNEELHEMLRRENQNQVSGSVAAAQFLQDRQLVGGERVQSASARHDASPTVPQRTDTVEWATWDRYIAAQAVRQEAGSVACSPSTTYLTAAKEPASLGTSSLDKRRMELECGAGGDHDSPYTFTLPISMPYVRAWLKLLSRVHNGEAF
jgi:hypothetical protein